MSFKVVCTCNIPFVVKCLGESIKGVEGVVFVDEKALYTAITSGDIAGAGLDVVETEPVKLDNPILTLDKVVVTGHSGHYSDQAIANIRQRPVEDISRILSREWPRGLINPEVKDKFTPEGARPGRQETSNPPQRALPLELLPSFKKAYLKNIFNKGYF